MYRVCIRLLQTIADAKDDITYFDCMILYTKPLKYLSDHKGDVAAATNALSITAETADKHLTAFKAEVGPLVRMQASQFAITAQKNGKTRNA